MPAPNDCKDTLCQSTFGNVCAGAIIRNGVVIQAAPILRRFVGQPAYNLWRWVVHSRKGTMRRLTEEEAADAI